MELVYIARAIRRYWWVLLIGAAVGASAGYFLESDGSAEYQATSILLLSPGSGSAGERFVQNEFVILGSSSVAEQASSDLGNVPAGQVSEGITLERIPESDLVRVTATAPTPASAQDLANAYADAYITLATGLADANGADGATLSDAIAGLEERLAEVNGEIATAMAPYLEDSADNVVPDIEQVAPTLATERSVLLGQYLQLLTDRNEIELGGDQQRLGSRVTEHATGATIATGAGSKLVVLVGITAGVMIGALGAVVMSRLSGMVLDAGEAASTLRAPVVATIPKVSSLRRRSILPGEAVPPALRKNIRELAVQAESVPSTDAGRAALVVLVAGAERFSGATTIAVALASHFADKGSQVLLIDADVARPRLSAALGDDATGIGALLGTDVESPYTSEPYMRIAETGVRFAGLGEHNTRRSLSRQDVAPLLDGAARNAQVVVIDGGVLTASASSVELSRHADAVVLTMPVQRQTRAGLEGVARVLASRDGGLLPVITAARRRSNASRTVAVERGASVASSVVEVGAEGADGPEAVVGEEAVGPAEIGELAVGPVEVDAVAVDPDEVGDGPVEHGRVTPEQVGPQRRPPKQRGRRAASAASRPEASRGT